MKTLSELPQNVLERLAFIEFLLLFKGWVTRPDLTETFSIGDAAATRDLRLYKDHANKNLELNQQNKRYEINDEDFQALFPLEPQVALSKLRTSKLYKLLGMQDNDGVATIPRLTLPAVSILAKLTRAITNESCINAQYFSLKKGKSHKKLLPHALFDNGIHWYVRACDLNDEQFKFKTYTLTRFLSIDNLTNQDNPIQTRKVSDHQWNRFVLLDLIPHPNRKNVKHPETVEFDYKMKEGRLKVQTRAVLAGYWLHYWNVDCTEDHSLEGYDYQLWLSNPQTLYDVESRIIAPGLSDYHSN